MREEGPIHLKLAAKRLAVLWGLQQVGARMARAVEEAAWLCERARLLVRVGDFLWPVGLQEVPVRTPVDYLPETLRDVRHIPPEELRAAMLLIVGHAIGLGVNSLIAETARLFGFGRTSERLRSHLLNELEALVASDKLVRSGDAVSLKK